MKSTPTLAQLDVLARLGAPRAEKFTSVQPRDLVTLTAAGLVYEGIAFEKDWLGDAQVALDHLTPSGLATVKEREVVLAARRAKRNHWNRTKDALRRSCGLVRTRSGAWE